MRTIFLAIVLLFVLPAVTAERPDPPSSSGKFVGFMTENSNQFNGVDISGSYDEVEKLSSSYVLSSSKFCAKKDSIWIGTLSSEGKTVGEYFNSGEDCHSAVRSIESGPETTLFVGRRNSSGWWGLLKNGEITKEKTVPYEAWGDFEDSTQTESGFAFGGGGPHKSKLFRINSKGDIEAKRSYDNSDLVEGEPSKTWTSGIISLESHKGVLYSVFHVDDGKILAVMNSEGDIKWKKKLPHFNVKLIGTEAGPVLVHTDSGCGNACTPSSNPETWTAIEHFGLEETVEGDNASIPAIRMHSFPVFEGVVKGEQGIYIFTTDPNKDLSKESYVFRYRFGNESRILKDGAKEIEIGRMNHVAGNDDGFLIISRNKTRESPEQETVWRGMEVTNLKLTTLSEDLEIKERKTIRYTEILEQLDINQTKVNPSNAQAVKIGVKKVFREDEESTIFGNYKIIWKRDYEGVSSSQDRETGPSRASRSILELLSAWLKSIF